MMMMGQKKKKKKWKSKNLFGFVLVSTVVRRMCLASTSTCPCLRLFAHKHVNKMLSNAVEALYIFDQHKSVFLLSSSFLPLNTDLSAVNQS